MVIAPFSRTWLLRVLVLAVVAAAHAAAQPSRTAGARCVDCVITVHRIATLGSADGPGSLSAPANAVAEDAQGRFWVVTDRDLPMVFDASGKFIRQVGALGRGPGEFVRASGLTPIVGDSMLIIDNAQLRATVVSPSFRMGRTIALPTEAFSLVPVRWPTNAWIVGDLSTPASAGWALHRGAVTTSAFELHASFGSSSGELRLDPPATWETIAVARDGRVWTSPHYTYRLTMRTADGLPIRTLNRDAPWFVANASRVLGNRTTPPSCRVVAIREDADGLLWVFASVPAENWRDAWAKTPPPPLGRGELRSNMIAVEKLWKTVVEVIDPRSTRVVARADLDEWVFAALPGRKAVGRRIDAEGVPQVAVLQFALSPKQ